MSKMVDAFLNLSSDRRQLAITDCDQKNRKNVSSKRECVDVRPFTLFVKKILPTNFYHHFIHKVAANY